MWPPPLLFQVVLPAVERLHTGSEGENGHGGYGMMGGMMGGVKSEGMVLGEVAAWPVGMDAAAVAEAADGEEGEEEEDDDDDDDDVDESPVKRRRA
jgi:hypothetical protein